MIDHALFQNLFVGRDNAGHFEGVAVGIVTNNQDPDKMGRVKVRFPWLSEEQESAWARIASPMAGKQRGLYCLPEVDDEVLVAFHQGCLDLPIVLGALWNGQDEPPATNEDGKNNLRLFKSRSGHVIKFDDSEGNERIEIIDKTGKNSVVIDSKNNSITIQSDQALTIQAGADLKLEASQGKLSLNAQSIALQASEGVTVEAQGSLELKATGETVVKGSVVNIN